MDIARRILEQRSFVLVSVQGTLNSFHKLGDNTQQITVNCIQVMNHVSVYLSTKCKTLSFTFNLEDHGSPKTTQLINEYIDKIIVQLKFDGPLLLSASLVEELMDEVAPLADILSKFDALLIACHCSLLKDGFTNPNTKLPANWNSRSAQMLKTYYSHEKVEINAPIISMTFMLIDCKVIIISESTSQFMLNPFKIVFSLNHFTNNQFITRNVHEIYAKMSNLIAKRVIFSKNGLNSTRTLDQLPKDVLLICLSFLDAFSLVKASVANSTLESASDNRILWEQLCRKHFTGISTEKKLDWKNYFIARNHKMKALGRNSTFDLV